MTVFADPFEDDGASFRVRRKALLDALLGPVIDHDRVVGRKPPKLIGWTLRPVRWALWAFLAILAVCVGDFVLWSLGVPV